MQDCRSGKGGRVTKWQKGKRGISPGLAVEACDVEIVSQPGPLAGLDDPDLVAAVVGVEDFLRLDEPVTASKTMQAREVGVFSRQPHPPVPGIDDDGVLQVDAVAA